MAATAVAFCLVAYFVTTLTAFGIVTIMSDQERDADSIEDYQGLFWRRPWLAGVLMAALLSLAGIPLTAGFIGKFFIVTPGIGSNLWLLIVLLVVNSAVGLFYYLRVTVAMFAHAPEGKPVPVALSLASGVILAALTFMLVTSAAPSPSAQANNRSSSNNLSKSGEPFGSHRSIASNSFAASPARSGKML